MPNAEEYPGKEGDDLRGKEKTGWYKGGWYVPSPEPPGLHERYLDEEEEKKGPAPDQLYDLLETLSAQSSESEPE